MAMDAKQDFLRNLEQGLSEHIKYAEMPKILQVASDILESYDMRLISGWTDDQDDCLDCYLDALGVECRSQQTIDRYAYVIRKMMDFVKVPTRRITVYHLRSYLQAEKARGVADRTLEGDREVFSAYFNWLQRESLIDKNPTANLGTIKYAKKEKMPYSAVEIEKLNAAAAATQDPIRNKAIIHFLLSTGCRVSEMTALNRDAVNIQTLECIVHGKGNKERRVYLSEVASMFLGEYLASRTDDNPELFHSQRGRLQPNGVRAMLKTIGAEAGIEKVHPHKFRRTLATDLSRHGMPIEQVASVLGHDKIDTTMQYVVLNNDDVRSNYRRYA